VDEIEAFVSEGQGSHHFCSQMACLGALSPIFWQKCECNARWISCVALAFLSKYRGQRTKTRHLRAKIYWRDYWEQIAWMFKMQWGR